MTNFTKGPWVFKTNLVKDGKPFSWTVGPAITEKGIAPDGGDLEGICVVAIAKDKEANAHLIASAPELYEALEDVCKQMEYMATWDKHGQSYYKAKRALSKARGEA